MNFAGYVMQIWYFTLYVYVAKLEWQIFLRFQNGMHHPDEDMAEDVLKKTLLIYQRMSRSNQVKIKNTFQIKTVAFDITTFSP